MARGIERGATPQHHGKIPQVQPLGDKDVLRFSFKLLDLTNKKFHSDRCGTGYIEHFLTRLRDVSTLTVREFRTNRSASLKAHKITFGTTTEVNGFSALNEQLQSEEAWQFELTRNEHGRVHGLLIGETFFLVWIDPDHLLYR